ncbi:MAG: CoA pyrophosphatase [Comamonas sp.]
MNNNGQDSSQIIDSNKPLVPVGRAPTATKKIEPVIDPRRAPVVQIDTALPAVAPACLSAIHLRHAFESAAPNFRPELHNERAWTSKPPAKAAVLVALVQRQEISVLLTQRSASLSSHSGQIAFPGGRKDPEDRDARDTALREAWEEVGLERSHVEVIGSLPEYATGSGFEITPVVGLVMPPFELKANPGEVDDIFEVPLSFLMNPAHHQWQQLDTPELSRRWLSMPYADPQSGHERFIWGATAGMLRNLYRFLLFQASR